MNETAPVQKQDIDRIAGHVVNIDANLSRCVEALNGILGMLEKLRSVTMADLRALESDDPGEFGGMDFYGLAKLLREKGILVEGE